MIMLCGAVYVFDEVFSPKLDSFTILRSATDLKDRSYSHVMNRLRPLLSQNPALGKSIREDPRFEPLRQLYEFRVLTGLQQPTVINTIDLPEAPASK